MPRKAIYAALYFLCIPVFAAIYYFCLPGSFYHSTVQFEYPVMNPAANAILHGIQDSMVHQLETQEKPKGCGDWQVDPKSIRVSSLDAREGKVSFTVSGESSTEVRGHSEYYFSERYAIALNQRIMTRAPGGSTSVYFLPVADTPAPKPLEHQIGNLDLSACLFPPDPEFFAPMLKLSPPVDGQMRDFALALRGFPSHIPGQFWRMIYFSATTITTLGFGDIVPLTTAARMIVALESVVGILLMGLFLNALAAQPRKRPSTDANPE